MNCFMQLTSAGEPDLQGNNEGHSDMDWEQLHGQ